MEVARSADILCRSVQTGTGENERLQELVS